MGHGNPSARFPGHRTHVAKYTCSSIDTKHRNLSFGQWIRRLKSQDFLSDLYARILDVRIPETRFPLFSKCPQRINRLLPDSGLRFGSSQVNWPLQTDREAMILLHVFVTDFVAVISSQSEGLGKMALGIVKIYLESPFSANRRCSRSVCSRSVCRGQLSWTRFG